MFTIVLVDTQIPQNFGNIARLSAGAKARLHLVGNIGFRLSDKKIKRAGLDYWDFVDWEYFPNRQEYWETIQQKNFYLLSTKAKENYCQARFQPADFLIFGSETKGLKEEWLEQHPAKSYKIPILEKKIRSYNLANCVAIVLYEAMRQVKKF